MEEGCGGCGGEGGEGGEGKSAFWVWTMKEREGSAENKREEAEAEAKGARRERERERENAPKLVPDVLALGHQARLVLAGARVHLQQVMDAFAQVAPPGHLHRAAGLVPQKFLFWVGVWVLRRVEWGER